MTERFTRTITETIKKPTVSTLPEVVLDSLPETPWDIRMIESLIPHRHPFLLVDRVVEVDEGIRLKAVKNISMGDPNLQGHFPGNPVYPGVLLVEGIAQSAALLTYTVKKQPVDSCLFTGIKSAKFKKPVTPGDSVIYEIELLKHRSSFFWFKGVAKVDGEVVAECEMSAQLG